MFDGEKWLREPEEIGDYFLKNFADVYASDSPSIPEDLGNLGFNPITQEKNEKLLEIPFEKEIKDCIHELHPLKAPGSYGFPRIFYRHYWDTVRSQVISYVQESFRIEHITKGMNKSFIVLIPKVKQGTEVSHFRPISLCNFTYKIISKIITVWLKEMMPRMISPNQRAFVNGRWIADNTVLAHELVHKIRKSKGNNGLMIAKIDLSKAYDPLEWAFIDKLLKCWGFSEKFRRLIFNCLSSVIFKLLLNGSCVGEVEPARGLPQGDPLSSYLFILCTDILSRLLDNNPDIKGIKVSRSAPTISHLLYADGLLLTGMANQKSARAIWDCLDTFCRWSGQQVNRAKSSVLFSDGMRREERRMIQKMWQLAI